MSSPKRINNRKIVCDASVWLQGLFGTNDDLYNLIKQITKGEAIALVNSYCVLEILRGVKRIAGKTHQSAQFLESRVWNILTTAGTGLTFDRPLEEAIIHQIRQQIEYQILAKILELESKDLPYITLAYEKSAPIVTLDKRSLYNKREEIKKRIGVIIYTPKEFLNIID